MLSARESDWFSLTSADTLKYRLEVMKEDELNSSFATDVKSRLQLLSGRILSE
jgi:hypothetical protein